MQLNLETDINVARKMLYEQPLTTEESKYYGWIYPFSNEMLNHYYNYYDLNNKNALCITSSGDQIIYASANGAKEIDAFDKNRFCKYYSALKIAIILAYNEKEFYKIFCQKPKRLLSKKIDIEFIKNFLSEECYIFWKELTKERNFKNNDVLFTKDGIFGRRTLTLNYNLLKTALPKSKINYYDMTAKDFRQYINKKYDAIFLSNILEWEWDDYDRKSLLTSYLELLNENGVLYDYYMRRSLCSSIPSYAKNEALENNIGTIGSRVLIYRNAKK